MMKVTLITNQTQLTLVSPTATSPIKAQAALFLLKMILSATLIFPRDAMILLIAMYPTHLISVLENG